MRERATVSPRRAERPPQEVLCPAKARSDKRLSDFLGRESQNNGALESRCTIDAARDKYCRGIHTVEAFPERRLPDSWGPGEGTMREGGRAGGRAGVKNCKGLAGLGRPRVTDGGGGQLVLQQPGTGSRRTRRLESQFDLRPATSVGKTRPVSKRGRRRPKSRRSWFRKARIWTKIKWHRHHLQGRNRISRSRGFSRTRYPA